MLQITEGDVEFGNIEMNAQPGLPDGTHHNMDTHFDPTTSAVIPRDHISLLPHPGTVNKTGGDSSSHEHWQADFQRMERRMKDLE